MYRDLVKKDAFSNKGH